MTRFTLRDGFWLTLVVGWAIVRSPKGSGAIALGNAQEGESEIVQFHSNKSAR